MSSRVPAPDRLPLRQALLAITPALGGVAVFSVAINALVFVSPAFMLQVYDRVLTSRNGTTLLMIGAIALALLLAYASLEKIRSMVLVQAGLRFDSLLTGPAFSAALAGASAERGGRHAQVLRDVDTLREFLSGPGVPTLLDAPWAPLFLAVCFVLHPAIGWVATGGALALFLLACWNEALTRSLMMRASNEQVASYDRMAAALRNADAIRGLGMAAAVRRLWQDDHERALVQSVAVNGRGGLVLALSKFLRSALQVGIIGTGAWLVIHQEVTGGVMFAASLIMGRALSPVEQALAQWRAFVAARAAWGRLSGALGEAPSIARLRLPRPTGRVDVEDLTVLAPGSGRQVVRRLSVTIPAGEVLAVVGPTGSGKSSLARALVGAWKPAGGFIRFDGNDIAHFDADELGAALGYLPQDVELFAGTIARNIARFGERDDAAVLAAAMAASAHGMIQRLPDGYETQVGEDGVGLSGGQRQRVGLARALFGDPALVVLDEPNANLDGEGDLALVEAIRGLKRRGCSVILVTHKPSLLSVVDRILVMHEGAAAKVGPRDLLLPLILGPNVEAAARTMQAARDPNKAESGPASAPVARAGGATA